MVSFSNLFFLTELFCPDDTTKQKEQNLGDPLNSWSIIFMSIRKRKEKKYSALNTSPQSVLK